MLRNLGLNKLLWGIVSVLALIAALVGVINTNIYNRVVSKDILSGMISQDLVTILAAVIILLMVLKIKEGDIIKNVIIISLVSYFFYGYGIYVIERIYTPLYFVYMAIFGLSFYSITYSLISLKSEYLARVEVSRQVRFISIGFSFLMPLIFYPLWIGQLLPLVQNGEKNEFFYSIPILDLCFIMPAFIIVAILTIRKKGLGLLMTPALFIHGFTLLFSVALGGMIKQFFNQAAAFSENVFYLILATLFLILALVYFHNFKLKTSK